VHPIVAEEAQTLLNKPDKEAGSVLSTVVSNLALFRDPVVSKNTGRSSFRIKDLMRHDSPVSLYLVVSPTDQLRLTPLTRLIITQIIFTLASNMDFEGGRSVEGYKHRLLLLLDEFPSLGKLDLFEKALGFIGGYGLKAFIIAQGLPQLFKAYGKDEAIRVGCHIQIAFAPNEQETAEYLSKATGQMTIIKENYSETTQDGKFLGGKSRQTSLQEVQRPLMTPDECRRLPGLKKDSRGDVIDAGDMLIFPSGFSCIYGKQTLYFKDPEMDRRSKMPPPVKSDNLLVRPDRSLLKVV
jgi:type IV secretion system protein VirD4